MSVSLSQEQFEQLLASISSGRKGSMTSCTASYNGYKDRETVEAFLTAVQVFKKLENINDGDALAALPLLLRDDAAVWWQGVKGTISTWESFETALRNTFAPKRPVHEIYVEACGTKQAPGVTTDEFVTKKRMLFSELPSDEQLTPKQQFHITYGLLSLKIREKVPIEKVNDFDDLLKQARSVEAMLKEKAGGEESLETCERSAGNQTSGPTAQTREKKKVTRCNFCKKLGHALEECRKRKKAMEGGKELTGSIPSTASDVKFSCYGCGTPGVYRSNCKLCANKPVETPEKRGNLGFCAINVQVDRQSRPMVFIQVNGIEGKAYVDTCAKISVASYDLYRRLKERGQTFYEENATVTLADGHSKMQKVLTFEAAVVLCGQRFVTPFIVLQQSEDNRTLLGIYFLQRAGIILNIAQFTWSYIWQPKQEFELYQERFVMFKQPNATATPRIGVAPIDMERKKRPAKEAPTIERVGAKSESAALPPKIYCHQDKLLFDGHSPRMEYMMRDAVQNIEEAENTLSSYEATLFDDIGLCALDVSTGMGEIQTAQLGKILEEFKDIFEPNGKPVNGVEHVIDTRDHPPIAVPPYRMSPSRKQVLRTEIQKMIEDEVIVPCASPWAAPVVMVPKPNGKVRVCVDYRRLNSITVPDVYPIPRIDDLLHEAKSTTYMSTLDLKAGYWQIRVRECDQDKTAFITPFGIYKFMRMPFGLRNAPSTFQRLIDRFRVSLSHIKLLAYLDDLIIFSTTPEQHLSDLRDVFAKMREYNFVVNKDKCRFGCTSIKYLGHLITPEGLQVDPEKVSAILDRPPPSNVKHLLSFLQTCSWYRRFIKNFSDIAEPLTRLTKKKAAWIWGPEQEKAYKTLKTHLTSTPILKQADYTKGYVIKTDASNYALGAVLVQGEGEGEHPIEYASRLLTPPERNYSTSEREALAVVWATKKFAGYIEGSCVEVVTDHQALQWLMKLKSPAGRLARWALQLQAYDIKIKYVPGRVNVVADTLSRPPCTESNHMECGVCMITVDVRPRCPAEIRTEQLKDERLQKIIHALEDTEGNENALYWCSKGYLMNDGLLYRHKSDADPEGAQLVVPGHEWANVLAVYHDDPKAGHYGPEKTFQAISRRYYWNGMRKYIESYVKHCVKCQRYKPSNQKPAGHLQTHALGQRFEVISFDLFGPLPPSSDDKTWIFIVEDINSRWVELFALEDATAERCAIVLMNEIFLRYGFPRRMISDNGPQFVSAIMQQVSFCLKIKHAFTPVYHPEANPVERKNRDLKTQLAILVGQHHREWPEHLPSIRFAMNTAVCKSTSHTPAFLTFGRELKTFDDNYHDFRQILSSENFIPEITPKLLQLANTLEKAKEVHEVEEEKRKQLVDQHRQTRPQYAEGDMVMVGLHPLSYASKGFSAKFAPRRDGPYLITKQHGPTSYAVADPSNPGLCLGIYHASALTPFNGSTQELPTPVQPLRKRGRPRKPQAPPARGRGRPKKQ